MSLTTVSPSQSAPLTRQRAPFLVELFRFIIALYGLGITSVSLLIAVIGERWWPLGLYNTLAHLFWFGALLLLPLALLTRSWRPALTLVLPSLAFMFSDDLAIRDLLTPPISARGQQLTVISYNLQWRGSGYETAAALIRRIDADVVALQEVSPEAGELIAAELADLYPHMAIHPQSRGYDGQAILSRYPILEDDFFTLTFGHQRTVLDINDFPLTIHNVHLAVPFQRGWRYIPARRGQEVDELIARVREGRGRVLVVGDLNMTARNDDYRRLREDAGLSDAFAQRGSGLGYTWRYGRLPRLLRIDYLLHSLNGVRTLEARVIGESGGSDHYPVWGRFDLYDPTLSYPD